MGVDKPGYDPSNDGGKLTPQTNDDTVEVVDTSQDIDEQSGPIEVGGADEKEQPEQQDSEIDNFVTSIIEGKYVSTDDIDGCDINQLTTLSDKLKPLVDKEDSRIKKALQLKCSEKYNVPADTLSEILSLKDIRITTGSAQTFDDGSGGYHTSTIGYEGKIGGQEFKIYIGSTNPYEDADKHKRINIDGVEVEHEKAVDLVKKIVGLRENYSNMYRGDDSRERSRIYWAADYTRKRLRKLWADKRDQDTRATVERLDALL